MLFGQPLAAVWQVVVAFAALAVVCRIVASQQLFWRASEAFLGSVYTIALCVSLFFGCKVVSKLRPPPTDLQSQSRHSGNGDAGATAASPGHLAAAHASEADARELAAQRAVMRRVFALCALCVVFFLLRGVLNLLSLAGLVPATTHGYPYMDPVANPDARRAFTFDVVRGQRSCLPRARSHRRRSAGTDRVGCGRAASFSVDASSDTSSCFRRKS